MAVSKVFEGLSVEDRQYVKLALMVLQKQFMRNQSREVSGSEYWHARRKEIDRVAGLIAQVSA